MALSISSCKKDEFDEAREGTVNGVIYAKTFPGRRNETPLGLICNRLDCCTSLLTLSTTRQFNGPFSHTRNFHSSATLMENHTATSAATDPKDPAAFLSSIIGVPVTVKLNSGVVYKGELQSVDGYMNIALEKCAEYVNGQLRRNYGDAFVRGNNGELFSARNPGRPFLVCSGNCGQKTFWELWKLNGR